MASFLQMFGTLALTWIGFQLLGPIGGFIGGLLGSVLFGTMDGEQSGPRLQDLRVQSSAFGTPLALTWGSVRLSANIIWSPGIREVVNVREEGGGLLSDGMKITTYTYFFSGAFSLCDCRTGPITTVRRIWANKILVYDATVSSESLVPGATTGGWSFTVHRGEADQQPDPYIQANRRGYGVGDEAPAYRKTAYIVIKNFPLEQYGNAVPTFEFEVIRGSINPPRYALLDPPASWSPGGFFGINAHGFDHVRDIWWHGGTQYEDEIVGVDIHSFTIKHTVVPVVDGGAPAFLSGGYAIGQCDTMTAVVREAFNSTPDWGYSTDLAQRGVLLDQEVSNSPFWHPANSTFSHGYWAIIGSNGLATGVETIQTTPFGPLWDWSYTYEYDGIAWYPLFGYSTQGGQHLWRAQAEAYNITPYSEWVGAAFRFRSGFLGIHAGWYCRIDGVLKQTEYQGVDGNATTDQLFEAITNHFIEYGIIAGYSTNEFSDPNFSHDRTRDRVWLSFFDETGHYHLMYVNLQQQDGYNPYMWQEVDHPALDLMHGNYGATCAYNPDLDWIIAVGHTSGPTLPDGGSPEVNAYETYLVCFDCSPASLAAPEPVHILHQNWGDDPAPIGTSGEGAISRQDWVIAPRLGGPTGMVKIWLGISYNADLVPLWQIVRDICLLSGLTDDCIDVSELTDLVIGYAVGKPTSGRAGIEPLMPAYAFDGVESGSSVTKRSVIAFRKRGEPEDFDIVEADLVEQGTSEDGEEAAHIIIGRTPSEKELPREVRVLYMDIDLDYQQGAQYTRRLTGVADGSVAFEVPLVTTAEHAKQISELILYFAWVGRAKYEFITTQKYVDIEPTDSGYVTADGYRYTLRITKKTELTDGTIKFEAIADDPTLYTAGEPYVQQPPRAQVVPGAVKMEPVLLDIPWWTNQSADRPGVWYYTKPYSTSLQWSSTALFISRDGGSSWSAVSQSQNPAVYGWSLSEIGEGGPSSAFIPDEESEVTVYVENGTLTGTDYTGLMQLTNLALLGDEIIAFRDAQELSGGQYRLTGLLRGLFGTEYAQLTHITRERFVILDPATVAFVPLEFSDLDAPLLFSALQTGGNASAAPERFVWTGEHIKPRAPHQIDGGREGDNDIVITWTARTRKPGTMIDGGENRALEDLSPVYQVEIWDTGFASLKRTLYGTSETDGVTYTAAQQTTDFGGVQTQIGVRVYQHGYWGSPGILGRPGQAIVQVT